MDKLEGESETQCCKVLILGDRRLFPPLSIPLELEKSVGTWRRVMGEMEVG